MSAPVARHAFGQHRLDRRRRADRHEGGRADLAARRRIRRTDGGTPLLVWEPQWGMDMMSDEARLELGFM
jgi:hypothetical protein